MKEKWAQVRYQEPNKLGEEGAANSESKEERSKEPRRRRASGNKERARNTKLAQDQEQGDGLGGKKKNHENTKDVEGKDRKTANERGKDEARRTTGTGQRSRNKFEI